MFNCACLDELFDQRVRAYSVAHIRLRSLAAFHALMICLCKCANGYLPTAILPNGFGYIWLHSVNMLLYVPFRAPAVHLLHVLHLDKDRGRMEVPRVRSYSGFTGRAHLRVRTGTAGNPYARLVNAYAGLVNAYARGSGAGPGAGPGVLGYRVAERYKGISPRELRCMFTIRYQFETNSLSAVESGGSQLAKFTSFFLLLQYFAFVVLSSFFFKYIAD